MIKLLAAVLALLQTVFCIGGYDAGMKVEEDEQPYPYVFVHGFAGWGFDDEITELMPYWGALNGDIVKFIDNNGCECSNASCGPFSSAWDRACELYAQLMGTTVDYGEAHSEKYGHARYGKTYDEPLVDDWSSENKVNFIAHSFGGNTVRLLATLLATGDADERNKTDNETLSPLFEGGNKGMIYSITTLSSPHNGTTLVSILGAKQGSAILNGAYCLISLMANSPINDVYDVDLSEWGMGDGFDIEEVKALANTADTGVYDMTLGGAAELNSRIEIQDDIYYFSYASDNTKESKSGVRVSRTLCLTTATAAMMGAYTGEIDGITVGVEWQANDGIVNTVSAIAPFNEPQKTYDSDAEAERGVWNIMPVQDMDHHSLTFGRKIARQEANEFAKFIVNQINIVSATY